MSADGTKEAGEAVKVAIVSIPIALILLSAIGIIATAMMISEKTRAAGAIVWTAARTNIGMLLVFVFVLPFTPVKNDPILAAGLIGLFTALAFLPGLVPLSFVRFMLIIGILVGVGVIFFGGRAEVATSAKAAKPKVVDFAKKKMAEFEAKAARAEASLKLEEEKLRLARENRMKNTIIHATGLGNPAHVDLLQICGAGVPAGEIEFSSPERGDYLTLAKHSDVKYPTMGSQIPVARELWFHAPVGQPLTVRCPRNG